jgi:hypothetical protein
MFILFDRPFKRWSHVFFLWGWIQRKTWCWDPPPPPLPELTNFSLCPLQSRPPTHLPWATLCESRLQPVARVDFIPQSGTLDLASEKKVKNQGSKVYRVNFVRFLQQYQQIHEALIYIPVKVYTVPTYSVILICSRRFREFSQYLFLRIISIVSK